MLTLTECAGNLKPRGRDGMRVTAASDTPRIARWPQSLERERTFVAFVTGTHASS